MSLQIVTLHDGSADFHDPPLNSVVGGEDAQGLPVYAGTRHDEFGWGVSIKHDGSLAWVPVRDSTGRFCPIHTSFHFLVLQIGENIFKDIFVSAA